MPLDEGSLVELARRGDVAAYDQIVRLYQDAAFRTAYVITGSTQDAEDAAQEAFVKAFYALPSFRAGSPLRPWLLQIVANEARNRRRAAGRRATLAFRLADAGDAALPAGPESPEERVVVHEERADLLRAVSDLRDEDRAVIACRYFLDLSEEEMSRVLGCARGTVKSRLSRALGRLRLRLTGQPDASIADKAGSTEAAHG